MNANIPEYNDKMPKMKKKPSTAGYWISGTLLIVGGILFITFFLMLIVRVINDQRLYMAPSEQEIVLDKPGSYAIYHEYNTVYNGVKYHNSNDAYKHYSVLIQSEEGDQVKVEPAMPNSTYNFGERRKGFSVYYININHSGKYNLIIQEIDENAPSPVFFSISKPLLSLLAIPGAILVSFSCSTIIISSLVFAATFYKRYKWEKRKRTS
ncbi:MAG: hypothetical protein H8E62_06750 [Planctomycetes bacterium]|nr:hypothetical protein [Planctomycetota bacterium]